MHKSLRSPQRPTSRSSRPAHGPKVLSILSFVLAAALVTDLNLFAQSAPPASAPATQNAPQPSSPTQALDLSDEVVRDVLSNFQRGLETHDIDRFLAVFDVGNMKDYPGFHDQMVAFFR